MNFLMNLVTSHISNNGPKTTGYGEVNYGSLSQLRRLERERRVNNLLMVVTGVVVGVVGVVLYFVL
jgi:hypothetical protein